jgi:hypothetical protein
MAGKMAPKTALKNQIDDMAIMSLSIGNKHIAKSTRFLIRTAVGEFP